MTQDNVVKLIQPEAFSDPLTEVLREGARACWRRPSRPRSQPSSAATPTDKPKTAANGWCAMAIDPSARS